MRKIAAAMGASLLVLTLAHAQDADPAGDRTLIANEHDLLEAVAKANAESFRALTLPGGVWTTKSGFIPMQLLVGSLDAFSVNRWEIVNPRVTWLDKDSAVVAYTWAGSGSFQNQPLAPMTLASTVWTRRNGKWLAVHHQETELARQ